MTAPVVKPVAPEFVPILESGEVLARAIDAHFERWPRGQTHTDFVDHDAVREPFRSEIEILRTRVHQWFNDVNQQVIPFTTYDRREIHKLLRRTSAGVGGLRYHEDFRGLPNAGRREGELQTDVDLHTTIPEARRNASEAMDNILRIVRTASRPPISLTSSRPSTGHFTNTAFILMWMDPQHPELVDVHDAVKDVFRQYGIDAVRADDIQHQERITDVVLERIAQSEFLFADLTGERPNVYYEVGYAHALGKRPILYRRKGTGLHFDLVGHNVPEYENVTQLRAALHERLGAITGNTNIS